METSLLELMLKPLVYGANKHGHGDPREYATATVDRMTNCELVQEIEEKLVEWLNANGFVAVPKGN
jgi:hypothetical protein